jgi:hypothetical protein
MEGTVPGFFGKALRISEGVAQGNLHRCHLDAKLVRATKVGGSLRWIEAISAALSSGN